VRDRLVGVLTLAVNATFPGRSADSRMTIAPTGRLAKYSRVYRTPPLR
jgi:hypothetical protein